VSNIEQSAAVSNVAASNTSFVRMPSEVIISPVRIESLLSEGVGQVDARAEAHGSSARPSGTIKASPVQDLRFIFLPPAAGKSVFDLSRRVLSLSVSITIENIAVFPILSALEPDPPR
jgi:hypothetical protein